MVLNLLRGTFRQENRGVVRILCIQSEEIVEMGTKLMRVFHLAHAQNHRSPQSASGSRDLFGGDCLLRHFTGLTPRHLAVVSNAHRLLLKDFQVVEERHLLIVQIFQG